MADGARVKLKGELLMAETEIREIGVPVRSVSWVRLHAGRDGKGDGRLYATMGQQADNLFVLQIDPKTGEYRQFTSEVSKASGPTATLMSRTGRLYVGSAYAGHLLCFDPEADALQDLGAIHPEAAVFPCRMDEDAEGRIWIGSYGTADLTCYDPATESFTPYGRMDDTDMYNYPLVNADGTVANLIRMTVPHVVVFDPETGRKETVGPVVPKGEGSIDLRRGADGQLYIASSEGDFRLDGWEAVPVDEAPPAAPAENLPDGSTFRFADAGEQINRKLEVRSPAGEVRTFDLDYEASGSGIFYLHAGPDACLYGSSILPLHLFRYDPGNESLADLGKCSSAGGEAYSMGNYGGSLYISAYTGATLSVYDPQRPYHFGDTPEDNPRDLGRIDDISYRPRSTLTGPMGRVWVASVPDYGMWGGPLSYYEPSTGEKKAYYRIVGDGSCYTLAHLQAEELLAVGTTISGGSGTQPKVDQAVLFLFDYKKEEKVWEGTLDRTVHAFNALVTVTDGRLFGTVTGGGEPELFVFDPETRTFTDRMPVPEGGPLDLGLQMGPDGKVYGFTSTCIYRLDRSTLKCEIVTSVEDGISVAGPILGSDIYFGTNHRLRAIGLFQG
jgi:streptogramin lyase